MLTLPGHQLNYGLESTFLQLQSAEWDIIQLHQREKRNAWTSALWVSDEWKATPWLTVSAGLRLHHFSVLGGAPYYSIDPDGNITDTTNPSCGSIVKTYAEPEPRLSLKWSINERNSLEDDKDDWDKILYEGDTITMRLMVINQPTFDYLRSLSTGQRNGANPTGNIKGDPCLGYFMAASVTHADTIVFRYADVRDAK